MHNGVDEQQSSKSWDNFEPEIDVQNLVYTCQTNTVLNLDDVAVRLKGTQYNPRKFAAVIIRTRNSPRKSTEDAQDHVGPVDDKRCRAIQQVKYHRERSMQNETNKTFHRRPKIAVLIFSPGKIVCTGAKTPPQARYIINSTITALKEAGYKNACTTNLNVENLVGSINLPGEINQGLLAKTYPAFCTYDPQQFPGAILRYPEIEPMTILVFRSGKLVITGARSRGSATEAFMKVYPILAKFALDKNTVASKYVHDPFVKPVKDLNRDVSEYVDHLIWKMSAPSRHARVDEEREILPEEDFMVVEEEHSPVTG